MRSWKEYLVMFAIAVAFSGWAMSFAISYKSDGLDEGLGIGDEKFEEHIFAEHHTDEHIKFSGGIGTYQRLASDYGSIAWLFGVCVVAAVLIRYSTDIGLTNFSCSAGGVAIIAILYKLWILIDIKSGLEPYFWETPRNVFAKATVEYDWILVVFASTFLIFNLFLMGISWKLRNGDRI